MEDPVAELAGSHWSGSAIEDANEGVLFSGTGFDEVEIGLRGGVDEHMVGGISDRESTEVGAIATQLIGEVVEDSSSSSNCAGHIGAAKAVEGLHFKMIF